MDKPTPLTPGEIEKVLPRLPGWAFEGDKLKKEFEFKDFIAAVGFINRLVPEFESLDHHADMHIYYNRVVFELSRYDIGGKVTVKDVEVAKKIEHLYSQQTY